MPTKNTKKTAAKPVATKKAPVKRTVKSVKTTKSTKNVEKIIAPAPEMVAHNCACHHCDCQHCLCGENCKCTAKSGCVFGRAMKKIIIAIILMAAGFVAGMAFHCPHKGMRGPRVEFAPNGCLVEESIKCPKLQQALPAMDINQDGCITREEFHAVKRQMRREIREIPVEDVNADATVAE